MDNSTKKFNNILLFVRKNKDNIKKELLSLNAILQENGFSTFIDNTTKNISNDIKASLLTEVNNDNIDLIIAIGGDGTILHAAKVASHNAIPLIGVNCGKVGFLTDIQADNYNNLLKMLHGHYEEEKRSMLRCDLISDSESKFLDDALNEVALIRGELVKIIEFDIYINNRFICNQRADGILISTPTGSTAYSLSAGGPIIQPSLDAICLVPLCAHTLNSRPIIIEPHNTITIKINRRLTSAPSISCDGRSKIFLPDDAHIEISKSKSELTLLHPLNYHYFETLKNKLHWERKPYAEFSAD